MILRVVGTMFSPVPSILDVIAAVNIGPQALTVLPQKLGVDDNLALRRRLRASKFVAKDGGLTARCRAINDTIDIRDTKLGLCAGVKTMVAESGQREPFDVYADAFTITMTPFGANLTFSLREAHPTSTRVPQINNLGTIRQSAEHLKTMVVVIWKQILESERRLGVKTPVAMEILNQLSISPEDWDAFWKSS